MTDGLSEGQRTKLERLIGRARVLLEADLASQASGKFGIDADGFVADEMSLRLDPSGLADRRDIVAVVTHLRSEGDSPRESIAHLLREAVFTNLNRLVAIRIAEALELLPPSLAEGDRSQGYRYMAELAPLLGSNGYWTYLTLCADELAGDVPVLFDPRNPLLPLTPSPAAFRDLVGLFADPENADLWTAPDCLGWWYQFFNSSELRSATREGSQAPSDSRALAVRTQFFTPRYVVDFLVQNSLGRRLLDGDPSSPLIDDLPLLVDPPTEKGEPVELGNIHVLDPACGSGHFLLAAYDVLERAWQLSGVEPPDAAAHIVASLWGIDIDPRCVQVASAALVFRARRSCPQGDLPRPSIICARALPATTTSLQEVLETLTSRQAALVRALSDALEDAPTLGPLLRVEQRIESEIRASIAGAPHGHLAAAVTAEQIEQLQDELLTSLEAVADAATATPAERLLATEVGDAVRFVAAMLRRYDVVLQNPPFSVPVPDTKPYLKAAYPWMPSKDSNLFAAFAGRGLELCKPGTGYVAAVMSRVGMFLMTYEAWRRDVLLGHRLVTLADLGNGVTEALVETAAYVVGHVDWRAAPAGQTDETSSVNPTRPANFIRLLKETNQPSGLAAAIGADRRGDADPRVFRVAIDELDNIPRSPIAYWVCPAIRDLFADHPSIEGAAGDVRQGLATGDDFRFVRAFWEVDPSRIALNRDETRTGRRWAPFAKGGEYSPFWADIHLVIDYCNDGEEMRDYHGSVIRSPQYYFLPGLTWPPLTISGFGIRVLPTGVVFGHKGPAVVTAHPLGVLGFLTSRLAQACIDSMVAAGGEVDSGGAARSYEVGLVKKLPWITQVGEDPEIAAVASRVVGIRRQADLGNEVCRLFIAPAVLSGLLAGCSLSNAVTRAVDLAGEHHLLILDLTLQLEKRIHELAELDSNAESYLDAELGPHPTSYGTGPVDGSKLRRLLQEPISKVIQGFIAQRGGSRAIANLTYFANRRLEVIAHGLNRSPTQIEAFRREQGIMPPGMLADAAEDVFSYLVGVAFGRWDLRAASAPEPELGGLFDPVPIYPPGMLLERDRPARITPADYEFSLPSDQLLLDQPGHPWGVVERVSAAAGLLVNDADALLSDLLKHLRGMDLRDHLRKHFFKDHLRRYSKSRRRAPIYWPLYVPSGAWGVWVYAPSLNRETLFAVEAAATARLNAAGSEISRLRSEQQNGQGGRAPRQLADLLEAEEHLAEELRSFRNEAERIAALGWIPDTDDGIVLCAAPLADLFPAWADARKERNNLRAGKYPWASVSKWADAL